MVAYGILIASAALYAMGIVAQSIAARRAGRRPGSGLGLLARLTGDPLYLLGFCGQVGGFALAFFARDVLPLYLVQAASSSAIGLATVFGVVVLRWRIQTTEALMLVLMALGLVALAGSSKPSVAAELSSVTVLVLLGVLLGVGVAMTRLHRTDTFALPAILSGVAFAVVAVTSRTLAHWDLVSLPGNPLTWLMLAAAVLGQASMAVALQRGLATAVVATADATTIILSSAAGLTVLGDQVADGTELWVAGGLTAVVIGVLVLGSPARTTSGSVEALEKPA
ncbi:hypothetical protein [Amycolatopsis regifaucium]|uniref:EamA domain-containing protein n=1 Tax=Amycolatopsis regifaucium TaxID=546365 RepID=A0A154M8X5_9PSEU|nr:hypothetical protein [Amycolatopsis regifaucium]KZB81055.1 hypothetical protein AVL48_37660 [Amycolatopsis regifaucium]OKA04780.1 hypothetical protein ATP06_0229580 [Amycolatopsis regifaucium]SFJ71388.1 hypothetical protein SAMN04489731_1338 [Amycolatopsis regifaucium]